MVNSNCFKSDYLLYYSGNKNQDSDNLEGWDGIGGGGRFKRGDCIGRSQYDIAKQLPFN